MKDADCQTYTTISQLDLLPSLQLAMYTQTELSDEGGQKQDGKLPTTSKL